MPIDLRGVAGIDYTWVGAHARNYGYPSGMLGQCRPSAVIWHITGGGSLAGLDSWFNNPAAIASAHIGIDGRNVHEYCRSSTAPYGAGLIQNPDLSNPFVKRWVDTRQNPNFLAWQVEVVASPSLSRVQPGTHLVSPDTWNSMLIVDAEAERQLGIPSTLAAHLGHFQIDGISRTRDPVYVYLPSDIFAVNHIGAPPPEEDDDMPDTELRDRTAAAGIFMEMESKLTTSAPIPTNLKAQCAFLLGGTSPRMSAANHLIAGLYRYANGRALNGKPLDEETKKKMRWVLA